MYELALFAGAGGGILGSMLSGHTCIGAVEFADFPREVLLARQRDGFLPKFPIWDDVSTFRIDNEECREYIELLKSKADELCISGGFPCQDISSAGKGAGIATDTRSGLWFEMARIIDEIRPRNVFVENSPMLTSRGLGIVLGDLAEMGYNAKWGVLGSNNVGGHTTGQRMWIVASSMQSRRGGWNKPNWQRHESTKTRGQQTNNIFRSDEINERSNSQKKSSKVERGGIDQTCTKKRKSIQWGKDWNTPPKSIRVGSNIPDRVDRLAAVGNAQDPRLVRAVLEMFK